MENTLPWPEWELYMGHGPVVYSMGFMTISIVVAGHVICYSDAKG